MADTVLGLFRERGKRRAKLSVTGRDIEERTLALSMGWATGCWQLDGDGEEFEMTAKRQEIMDALSELGRPAQLIEIAKMIGQPKSHAHSRSQDLVAANLIRRDSQQGKVLYSIVEAM